MVNRKIILMSIRPEYVEKILAGEKQVELRRRCPNLEPDDVVVVYATSPVCEIVGAFSVAEVLSLPVRTMWRQHREVLGVQPEVYDAYFEGRSTAYGIAIAEVWSSKPIGLHDLRRRYEGFVPPQSYMYWPDKWSLPHSLRRRSSGRPVPDTAA